MPRILNIDKLEKKFSTVTKSKDSIQNLSLWIICHKHFHDEICRHWLTALEKSPSAHRLTLFYVANDVLQHCKKKNAVEYRVAFAEVLEDAVLLAKEDKIKDEILRMINIWNERNVYSSDYLLQLTDILNAAGSNSNEICNKNSEKKEEEKKIDSDVAEDDEAKILATYKTNNLITCLQELIELKKQINENQKELDTYEDVIALPAKELNKRINNETLKRYERIVEASKSMENYLSAAKKETTIRKETLKLLEHSKVFYTAQNEEVRRVVHAYRIFGKRLKLMQQKLNEKISTFPEPTKSEKLPSPNLSSDELSLHTVPSVVDCVSVKSTSSTPELISASSFLSCSTNSVVDLIDLTSDDAQSSPNSGLMDSSSSLEKRIFAFTQHQAVSHSSVENMTKNPLQDQQSAQKLGDKCADSKIKMDGDIIVKVKLENNDDDQVSAQSNIFAVSDSKKEQLIQPSSEAAEINIREDISSQCVKNGNQRLALDENKNKVLEYSPETTVNLNGDAGMKSSNETGSRKFVSTVDKPLILNNSDPLKNVNKLCHPSSTRNDCTKTTFTCLENPECSVSETSRNSQSMSCLLESMKLLSRLMPRKPTDTRETTALQGSQTDRCDNFPLSAIFKIVSEGFKSNVQGNKDSGLVLSGNEARDVSKSKTSDVAEVQSGVETDDLMPMDMDIDSDEEI